MLNIRKVREDMRLDEEIGLDEKIDRKKDEVDIITLRMAAINFGQSKTSLLEYLRNQDDYEPKVKLEALQAFLKLIDRSGEELEIGDKHNILKLLKTVLTNEESDWRMRLIARDEFIKLGKGDTEFAENIRKELHDIILDKDSKNSVKLDVARILAALGEKDDKTREVLERTIEKENIFSHIPAAVSLIEMGDNAGLDHIIKNLHMGGKSGFWAAIFFGQLLIEKKPNDLNVPIEDVTVNNVIEQLENGSKKNSKFNKYMKNYAERIAKELRGKLGEK